MIRGLEKIKHVEEYELAKKDLEYCISEYKWISNSKDPKKDVETELLECSRILEEIKRKEDESNEEKDGLEHEEFDTLSRIQTLKTKYIPIVRGEYKSLLRQNITGLVLMLEEYEASIRPVSFGEVVKGIFSGDKNMIDYLKKKYMLSLSNMYGTVPAPENLNLEKVSDILDYMNRNYDLPTIDLSDTVRKSDELGLVLVEEPVVGIKAEVIKSVTERADSYIETVDISKKTLDGHSEVENGNNDLKPKEELNINKRNQHDEGREENKKREHDDKGEIGE